MTSAIVPCVLQAGKRELEDNRLWLTKRGEVARLERSIGEREAELQGLDGERLGEQRRQLMAQHDRLKSEVRHCRATWSRLTLPTARVVASQSVADIAGLACRKRAWRVATESGWRK